MTQQARRPLEPLVDRENISKSNHYYTRGITPKCITRGGTHLRCFAPEQHSSEETSQRWRAVGETACGRLTEPEIETQISRTDSVRLTTELTSRFVDRVTISVGCQSGLRLRYRRGKIRVQFAGLPNWTWY